MQIAKLNSQSNTMVGTSHVKPARREFYNTLVIRNNGAIVPEAEWKNVAAGSSPREVRKQLKGAGMQAVRVFDKVAYDNSRKSFKEEAKVTAKFERETVITNAFKEAEVRGNPRISAALKTLLPLFRTAPPKKTTTAFRNIICSISSVIDITTPVSSKPNIGKNAAGQAH